MQERMIETLNQYYDLSLKQLSEAWIWLLHQQVSLAGVLLVVLFVAVGHTIDRAWSRRREGKMGHLYRKSKQIVQYAIGETILELFLAEKITKNEFHYWFNQFGNKHKMQAMLMRKKVTPEKAKHLKAKFQRRREAAATIQPNIPGPLPGGHEEDADGNVTQSFVY